MYPYEETHHPLVCPACLKGDRLVEEFVYEETVRYGLRKGGGLIDNVQVDPDPTLLHSTELIKCGCGWMSESGRAALVPEPEPMTAQEALNLIGETLDSLPRMGDGPDETDRAFDILQALVEEEPTPGGIEPLAVRAEIERAREQGQA